MRTGERRALHFFSALALLLAANCSIFGADSTGQWTLRLQAPTFAPLSDVTFGDSRFVAVGEKGTILYSQDAAVWISAASGTDQNLNTIARTESGLFVAVGASQTILISTNGISWELVRSNFTGNLTGIVYGGGKYIATGPGTFSGSGTRPGFPSSQLTPAIFLESSDAIHWNSVETTNSILSITFGKGRFAAIKVIGESYAGSSANDPIEFFPNTSRALLLSENGSDWRMSQAVPDWAPAGHGSIPGFKKIQFLNDAFFVTGLLKPDLFTGFEYPHDLVAVSQDGETWSSQAGAPISLGLVGIASNGIRYATAGNVLNAPNSKILISTNTQDWAFASVQSSNRLKAIALGKNASTPLSGKFVAVGNAGTNASIYTSDDGIAWTGVAKAEIVVKGPPGVYDVLKSESLESWEEVGTVTIEEAGDEVTFGGSLSTNRQFFQFRPAGELSSD